jgi:polyisoprenoid-binding protein YceI
MIALAPLRKIRPIAASTSGKRVVALPGMKKTSAERLSMKATGALLTLFVSFAPAMACASDWEINPAHSKILFSVSEGGFNAVTGRFDQFAVTVEANEATPVLSKVEAQIDVASINTEIIDRDKHLRSAEGFDAAKFPRITFISTGVVAQPDRDHYLVTGNLTMHGVTKSVNLDARFGGRAPNGIMKAGMEATAKLSRRDFGLNWNVMRFDAPLFADEVDITMRLEFMPKAPPAAGAQK